MNAKTPDQDQDKPTTPPDQEPESKAAGDLTVRGFLDALSAKRAELGLVTEEGRPLTRMERRIPQSLAAIPIPPARTAEEIAENDARVYARREADEKAKQQTAIRLLFEDRGKRYQDCRLSNFMLSKDPAVSADQRKVLDRLLDYAENMRERIKQGQGVVLLGPKGTGKDHLMAALMTAAIASGATVKWVNGLDLYGQARDLIGKEVTERSWLDQWTGVSVLAISDPLPPVAGSKLTEWQASTLFRILDRRYSQMRPTWLTINVASSYEAEERMGPQNVDRLRHGTLSLACDWPSFREGK